MFALRDFATKRSFKSLILRAAATGRLRFFTFTLLLVGLLGALTAFSSWSGAAANPAFVALDLSAALGGAAPAKALGPIRPAAAATGFLEPFQGCTVNCTATVPATGQVNSAVSFTSTVTPSGCAGQPTYDWNFGDGTPHSNQQNPTHTYTAPGTYTWNFTASASSGTISIETIAGGLGEGNPIKQAPFGMITAIARDPQGRGLYVADTIGGSVYIRFVNTSAQAVTLGGRTIAAGTVRSIAGGGTDLANGAIATQADLGTISGLDVSPDGNLVYFIDQVDSLVRAVNVSASNQTVAGQTVAPARVQTLASSFGAANPSAALNGLSVKAATGDVYVTDATPGNNKVYKITPAGAVTTIAGNGATTGAGDPFSSGPATSIPLLQPYGVEFDSSGNVVIADTGHGRVIRVDSFGTASLVTQFAVNQQSLNPFPSAVTLAGGNVYSANGNQQTITRVTNGVVTVAGLADTVCDYTTSACGDGGPALAAGLNLLGSTASIKVAAIRGDSSGIFVADQGTTNRGRIRYVNLTGGAVTLGGTIIPAGGINTIAGNGLTPPYDGGLATSATLNTPTGVTVDGNGNLWIADTLNGRIRFVNRSANPIKIFAGTASEQTVAPGVITTVNREIGNNSENVPASQSVFDAPQGLFATAQGIYVVDSRGGPTVPPQFNGRRTSLIKFINTSAATVTIYPGSASAIQVPPGNVAIIGGGGLNSSSNGDGSFATGAKFIGASDLVVASGNTLYITDVGQKAVRRIDGNTGLVSSLTLPARQYTGIGISPGNRLYLANYDDGSVLRENSAGAGSFSNLATGLNKPRDVAPTADDSAYVTVGPATVTEANHQIVFINSGGTVTALINSPAGFDGDGGPVASARVNLSPSSLVVGAGTVNQLPQTVSIIIGVNGEALFTDSNNNRVRRLSASQVACTKTGTITIAGDNPVPTLTSLSPSGALQNSGAFTLTVTGTNFVPGSVVRFNGQARTTTYVSGTQLTAAIPIGDLATIGAAAITVFNPAPAGGASNALTFTVTGPNPVPTITSLSPSSAAEGSPGFTLTVNGTGFVPDSVVRWDGSPRPTTFVSATQLRATITASDIVGTGTASVTVFNPTPGGGVSNAAPFTIVAGSGNNPVPSLLNVSPNPVAAGGPQFTLTVTGDNFTSASKVRLDGIELVTTVVNAQQLTALVPASAIATTGAKAITVFTPAPGGGTSNSIPLNVVVQLTSVSAASFLGSPVAAESIVAGFGVNLATGVEVASTIPLPTSLLNTVVTVRDSQGQVRNAPLFFVSPGQVNYQVPIGTADGPATVTVRSNNTAVGVGTLTVTRVAPGVITANSNGLGVPAALVLRAAGNGTQTYETLARFDQGQNQYVATEIDLGPASDQVFLILYGTGFRFRAALANVTATIGGVAIPVLFAETAPGFVGLDQINLGPIPRSLVGRKTVDLIISINGQPANTVQLSIK